MYKRYIYIVLNSIGLLLYLPFGLVVFIAEWLGRMLVAYPFGWLIPNYRQPKFLERMEDFIFEKLLHGRG